MKRLLLVLLLLAILTAPAAAASALIRWNPVDVATSYTVYQNGEAKVTVAAPPAVLSLDGLSGRVEYTVSGRNAYGEGPQSAPAVLNIVPPAAPAGLSLTINLPQ